MLRVRTCVKPIQCYSLAGMTELQRMLDDIAENPGLVRHFVLSSDVAGVFNFGGDLALFVLLVRAQDIDSLKMYGRRCIDLVWWMETAASRGIHTTVLVQGDTLGGGLESVLPFHKVIFERSAQAGFPEVLFNLFPGMGATAVHDPQGRIRRRQRHDPQRPPLHGRAVAAPQPGRRGGGRRRRRGSDARDGAQHRAQAPRHAGRAECPARRGTDPLRVAGGGRRPVGRDGADADQPGPAADGAARPRPGAQGRRGRGGRGRGDQAHRTRYGLGRTAWRQHRLRRGARNRAHSLGAL
ncbi:hypothetical protein FSC37_07165 [Piscinibacter aquaticus]|uniref:Enoyl-CoA hydratase/isomerase family protein n=1 Tax=Piscinibacter aquaticus TaxID=392597 RepID=A0A5C6TYV3_9BURK|nr:hypothetical protein FSC37_07165 [Piscinibacter aquaticus]